MCIVHIEGRCTLAVVRRYQVWIDANGATTLTLANGSASLTTLIGDIKAQSNADVLNDVENTLFVNGAPAPGVATYQSVRDSAKLVFTTAAGNVVTLTVPAPKSSFFLADQETVDPTAAATIIAAALLVLTDEAGNAVTAFQGGFRQPTRRDPL